jgi:hypothetical protein
VRPDAIDLHGESPVVARQSLLCLLLAFRPLSFSLLAPLAAIALEKIRRK